MSKIHNGLFPIVFEAEFCFANISSVYTHKILEYLSKFVKLQKTIWSMEQDSSVKDQTTAQLQNDFIVF